MSGGMGCSTWRERLALWLLVVYVMGWLLLPSTRELGNRHHDLVVWLGLVPVVWVLSLGPLWRAVRQSEVVALSLVLVGWMALSMVWSRAPLEHGPVRGVADALGTVAVLVAVYLVLDSVRLERLAAWFAATAGALAVVGTAQLVTMETRWHGRLSRPFNFEHPNLFGHALAVATVMACWLALARKRTGGHCALWLGVATVCGAGVVLTLGRTSMIAAVVGVVMLVALSGRPRLALMLVAGLIAAVAVVSLSAGDAVRPYVDRGDAGRSFIWGTLAERIGDRPLIGNGLLSSDDVRFQKGSSDFPSGFTMPHAHSVFVSTAYHGGLIGLGLLLGVLGSGLVAGWRLWRRTGDPLALTWLIVGTVCLLPDGHRIVGNPHLSSVLLFWIPIGLVARQWHRHRLRSPWPWPAWPEWTLPAPPRWFTAAFLVAVGIQRLLHFGPDIDGPHVWRQMDTAHYAQALAEEDFNLLYPQVCWMGDHGTVALEFPLAEAVMAAGYRVLGADHRVARAVTLGFFALAAVFLWLLVAELWGRSVAWWATLAFSGMPLGLFYSRAVHIDPAALAFAHAMAWCWVRGIRRRSPVWLIVGAAVAVPAVLIKAPYAAVAAAPVVVLTLQSRRLGLVTRWAPVLAVPVASFLAWRWHAGRVNAAMPDWSFIPTYRPLVDNAHWYFGHPSMRLDLELWMEVVGRLITGVTGWIGLVFALAGCVVALLDRRLAPLAGWLAAGVLYILVFFNLNVHHDYYQLPFLAPLAVALAVGGGWIVGGRRIPVLLVAAMMTLAAAEWIARIEARAYTVPTAFLRMAAMVRDHTPEDALVVVSYGGLDCRSPHILYPAHRDGWSIPDRDLTPALLERLVAVGATHLAVAWAGTPDEDLLESLPRERLIHHGPLEGRVVAIYRLDPG